MTGYGIGFTGNPKDPFSRLHKGIDKLAQLCEKMILTTYGTDEKHPDTGCLIKTFIGRNFSSLDEAARLIDQEIQRVKEQIIHMQMEEISKGFHVPLDEQLQNLTLVDVSATNHGIIITYELTNREGQSIEGELVPE